MKEGIKVKKLAEQLCNNEEEDYELIIQRQKLAYLFEKTYYKDTPNMFDSLLSKRKMEKFGLNGN